MRKENAKSSDATDDTESLEEGSFFRRWSSRKLRARRGEAEDVDAVPPEETADDANAVESTEPEPVLTDEDMPSLESLNEDSDFSPFMSPGVSESLRNLALRKMFLSSKYNFTDGLDDYADDFTKFAPLGDVITSDMRHQIELQAERAREKLEEEAQAAMQGTPEDQLSETQAAEDASEDQLENEDSATMAQQDSQDAEAVDEPPDAKPDRES